MIIAGHGFSFDIEVEGMPSNIRDHITNEVSKDSLLCNELKRFYALSLTGDKEAELNATKLLTNKIESLKAI